MKFCVIKQYNPVRKAFMISTFNSLSSTLLMLQTGTNESLSQHDQLRRALNLVESFGNGHNTHKEIFSSIAVAWHTFFSTVNIMRRLFSFVLFLRQPLLKGLFSNTGRPLKERNNTATGECILTLSMQTQLEKLCAAYFVLKMFYTLDQLQLLRYSFQFLKFRSTWIREKHSQNRVPRKYSPFASQGF